MVVHRLTMVENDCRTQAEAIVGGPAEFEALYRTLLEHFQTLAGEVLTLETQLAADDVDDGLVHAVQWALRSRMQGVSDEDRTTVASALVQRGWEDAAAA